MHILYNIGIRLYIIVIGIAAVFNKKARLWKNGRKGLLKKLKSWRTPHSNDKVVWVHCASLGEFEQARPIIENIKKEYPEKKIIVTFFSPSGYEIRKNYNSADYVCYLPADTPSNAREFIRTIRPEIAIVVKYEYWANYFFECTRQGVPLFIVSAILRKDQRFFGIFSGFWKKVLACVTHFFVQNEETQSLLRDIGLDNTTLTGDTRFDRVIDIANQAKSYQEISNFRSTGFCVVAGSSWPAEENMLEIWFEKKRSTDIKLILVPHEISDVHISGLQRRFPDAIKWSEGNNVNFAQHNVLIVDTIGLLSSIYQYGDVAIIGGGFGKGIHNILEAAVWKIPVLFGPKYEKFQEAKDLIRIGGALSFKNRDELEHHLNDVKLNPELAKSRGNKAGEYVKQSKGATATVTLYLKQYIVNETVV